MFKGLLQFTDKDNPSKIEREFWIVIHTSRQWEHGKMLNFISNQGNVDQNHEMPFHKH